jgi:type VI secretion system protein ImpJ
MASHAVHWHEGMFLRPHHFQTAQRNWDQLAFRGDRWSQHYAWGLRAINLDLDALANYRVVVRALQARLRDGGLVSIPEEGMLAPVELRTAFDQAATVRILLAVPVLSLGRANVNQPGREGNGRYLLDSQDLEDENTGINAQPVQVRRLNVKLLLDTQDKSGYEVLPIAQVEKSSRAGAVPQLDEKYIPPLLACDAWKPLVPDLLQNLFDRIGKKIELLSGQVVSGGINFDSHGQGDALILAQLRALNEGSAVLGILSYALGVHPLQAYLELCRLAGQLAIFGAGRRLEQIPAYDHDDLGKCFYHLCNYMDTLLTGMVEPEYEARPFIGAGLRMQVALEPTWLQSDRLMFIGVKSKLAADECIKLLTRQGQLEMKVGSTDRVETLVTHGQPGLRLTRATGHPGALPAEAGLSYLQLSRDPAVEWSQVQRTLSLAIRLNENFILGKIQGEKVLTIKTPGQPTTLQFTLYVVRQQAP